MNYLLKGTVVFFPLIMLLAGQNVCAKGVAAVAGEAVDIPMGQSAGGDVNLLPEDAGQLDDEDLFGLEGGYFLFWDRSSVQYGSKLNFIKFSPTCRL